jgi:hypothetical protein
MEYFMVLKNRQKTMKITELVITKSSLHNTTIDGYPVKMWVGCICCDDNSQYVLTVKGDDKK